MDIDVPPSTNVEQSRRVVSVWGVEVPAELFGLLCWLVAGFLGDSSDRKSLKRVCKDALIGFRSNATEVTILGSLGNLGGPWFSPRFYKLPFSRVKHMILRPRAEVTYGIPFAAWTRDIFPVASTMGISVATAPNRTIQRSDIAGLWKYPLGITSFKGTDDDLNIIAEGFEQLAKGTNRTAAEMWNVLRCVTITDSGCMGRRPFELHAKKVLQHHRLDQVCIYDPVVHLDDIMVHPPKRVIVDPATLALVANHPRLDEVESVALAYLYDTRNRAATMMMNRASSYDSGKLVPKLDATSMLSMVSLVESARCLLLFSNATDYPSRLATVSLIARTINGVYYDIVKYPPIGALDCDIDFLVQALCRICDSAAGPYMVIRILRTLTHIADFAGRERPSEDFLATVARRVFTSAQAGEWPDNLTTSVFGVCSEFRLWREYFLSTRFCVRRMDDITECNRNYASLAGRNQHIRVTLAENYLRCDESAAVDSSLRYLYWSIYGADSGLSDEGARQTLMSRREHIQQMRKALQYAHAVADNQSDLNLTRIYEKRLEIAAAQCTGPLGEALLGTGEIVLR